MKYPIFAVLIVLLGTACKKDDPVEFDREAMLDNMASAVIIPSLSDLGSKLNLLHLAAQEFVTTSNQVNLDNLRSAYLNANSSFQQCKFYDFGPLNDYAIVASMNTYPCDTAKIESNITAGTYVLGAVENAAAIGFPAIDYLLYFSTNQLDQEIIDRFTIGAEAAGNRTYLTDLTGKMKTEFTLALNDWNNTYKTTFIAADGNDVGSSTNILFNALIKDLELVKNAKIGIPSGQQTGGLTLPHYVEGFYSKLYSLTWAVTNLSAAKNFFNGGQGKGLDDYIRDVEDESITESLADRINQQFDLCISLLNQITPPYSTAVDNYPAAVTNAYLEIKKLVTLCKTDMASILGLLVTYQDNDGD